MMRRRGRMKESKLMRRNRKNLKDEIMKREGGL
jgi:hypothetical protein